MTRAQNRVARWSVVLATAVAFVSMLVCAALLSPNFDIRVYFPENGMTRRYLDARSALFDGGTGITFFVVTGAANYSDVETQATLERLVRALQSSDVVARDSVQAWSHNMKSWLSYRAHTSAYNAAGKTIPPDRFYAWLRDFLAHEGAPHGIDLVWRRADGQLSSSGAQLSSLGAPWHDAELAATRIWGRFRALDSTSDFLAAIDAMQQLTDSFASLHSFSYSPFYVYLAQFVGIKQQLALALALCLVGVFLVALCFSCNVRASLLLALLSLVLSVDLLGVQYLFGVSLNAVTLLIAASGIGIGAEFLNHSLGAFRSARHLPPLQRLDTVASSIGVYLVRRFARFE